MFPVSITRELSGRLRAWATVTVCTCPEALPAPGPVKPCPNTETAERAAIIKQRPKIVYFFMYTSSNGFIDLL
jgi:hypothetical protein